MLPPIFLHNLVKNENGESHQRIMKNGDVQTLNVYFCKGWNIQETMLNL
jgi:hypothetical protein